MGVMNKLNMLGSGSVGRITQVQGTGKNKESTMRQPVAGNGKTVPVQTAELASEQHRQEVVSALTHLAGHVQNISRELNFSVDQDTDRIVVTVLDESTGDVIRQIPSEEMLKLARQLADSRERGSKGLLFSEDV